MTDEPKTPTGNFTRRIEDFECGHCANLVRGDGYTNHCPVCLWSRHVDTKPGDRAADCGGLMEPLAAGQGRSELFLVHRCVTCRHLKRNRVDPRDNRDEILAHFGKPIPDTPS